MSVFSHFAFQQLRLERKAAFAHDALAGLNSVDDALVSARRAAKLHVARLEMALLPLLWHKDDCSLVDALDGLFGDDQLTLHRFFLPACPGFEADLDEHPDLEPLLPVRHLHTDTRRARLLVQH